MNGANGEWDQCAVCGRTILRGERAYDVHRRRGEKAEVCPLCKPRAEASGWLPEAYAAARDPSRRPRRRGATALRERIARTVATVTDTRAPAEGPREPDAAARSADPARCLQRQLGGPQGLGADEVARRAARVRAPAAAGRGRA